ncbi:MAG: CapA family protein [bacterium]
MIESSPKKAKFIWLAIFLLIPSVLFAGYAINSYYQKTADKPKISDQISASSSSIPEKPKPKVITPTTLSLNSLFFGDVFWGRYVDDWSQASSLKYSYPFSGLSSFDRQNYQAWIADLECPVTSTYISSAKQDDLLKFSCPTGYVPEAAKWFNAFTLANNHTDNMQEVDGLGQTRANLEASKIQYFGHFDNAFRDTSGKAEICEVVSLPSAQVFPELKENEVRQESSFLIPVALCGYHNVFKLPTQSDLDVIEEYSKYLPTIVMPHQGQEYKVTADGLQQSYFRQMLDLGADAVIGDHPHVVQNTEAYKGKLIVYSMGNFIFDQQVSPSNRQSVAVNLNFNFKMDANLQKWLEISQGCLKFKDNCLKLAQDQNLTKPKFSLTVDLIPTDNSNKLAKKADPTVAGQVLKQAKWADTKTKLDYSYTQK